jgi:hypothetical protein
MRFVHFIFSAFTLIAASCSSPQPSERFLTSPMSIGNPVEGQTQNEQLRIRPVDLYNLFDQNVKTKRWKRIHENSWIIEIKGRDPVSRRTNHLAITLSVDPNVHDTVVVTEIRESGTLFSPEETARMIRELDNAFNPRK